MRVLQIATQVPVPPIDGGKLSIYGITKSLHERGHKIDFVCYKKHDDYQESYNLLKEICVPYILDVQADNNIIGAVINLFSAVPYNASKYYNSKLKKFLKNYFLKNLPDIVHIDHLFLGWVVEFIRGLTTAPVILRAQNLEMNIMKRYYENQKNSLLKYYSKLQFNKFLKFEPKICEKFDLCIMISEIDKIALLEHNADLNLTDLPPGVDSSLLEIEKREIIPFSLVHIGHTDWYPNYDGLTWFVKEVMPEIVKKIPQIKLYIYGGGKTSDFQVPTNLKENINVVGFVENLWEELKNKSLAIVPLRIGSGIRLKILELLATGTNIITTSIGKEGINVSDGKEVIIADTKEEYCEKILRYFHNGYDITRMRKNGKQLIRNNYTWETISQQLEKLYLNLLDDKYDK